MSKTVLNRATQNKTSCISEFSHSEYLLINRRRLCLLLLHGIFSNFELFPSSVFTFDGECGLSLYNEHMLLKDILRYTNVQVIPKDHWFQHIAFHNTC